MLTILFTVVFVAILFGLTIFVHELGHFVVARWCGLKVDAFAIGFGPALWQKRINGVQYKIGIFPLGGYVALPQLDPSGGNPHKKDSTDAPAEPLAPVTPFKKILVSLAGVTCNMILAFFLAWLVYVIGKPSAPHETNTIVGHVATNSAAYAAGIRPGDVILSVNDETVSNWQDILLKGALTDTANLSVQSGDRTFTAALPTELMDVGIHMIPGLSGMDYVSVAATMPDSSAAKAGIKPGDLLLAVNNIPLLSIPQLIDLVNQFRDQDIPVLLKRGQSELTVMVRPAYSEKEKRALIGIQFNTLYADKRFVAHPTPISQIREHAGGIFRFLRALVTPSEAGKASQGVGGPLAILIMFWYAVQSSVMVAIWFTVMVNVNLAIINLLPLPVLDGGHICFALWEAITGKPVHPKIVNALWNGFAMILIALFLLLTLRDVRRWILPNFAKSPAEAPAETNTVEDVAPASP